MTETPNKQTELPVITTSNIWGTFTTQGEGKLFTPDLKLPRISNPWFSAWIKLCYHFADYQATNVNHKSSLEVQTIILCNKTDWIFCIPKQEVSSGAVRDAQLNDCVNILTGESYLNHKYPRGYRMYGTSHSHGLISAFFSSVDDASELGYPGIHCTIGSLIKTEGIEDTFSIAASVVENFHRYCVDANYIFDLDKGYDPSVEFHPNVLKQINVTPVSKAIFGTTRYYNYADVIDREEDNDFNSAYYNSSPFGFSQSLMPVKPRSACDREFDTYVDEQSDLLFTQLAALEQQGTIDGSITENVCIMFDDELHSLTVSDYSLNQKKQLVAAFCQEVLDLYNK